MRILVWCAVGFLSGTAHAQTIISGGDVTGNWLAAASPYLIHGDICIPAWQTLSIEAGVQVIFQGHYQFLINGFLQAYGLESDSIILSASEQANHWRGLRFVNAPDFSRLNYCMISSGRALGVAQEGSGGGVFCDHADPILSHCTIRDNLAEQQGGGLYCWDSSPSLSYCLITSNSSSHDGGGIFSHGHGPVFNRCAIVGNAALHNGGGCYFEACLPRLVGCTISQNAAALTGGGVYACLYSSPDFINSIIQGNAGYGGLFLLDCFDVRVEYCDFYENSGAAIAGNSTPLDFAVLMQANVNGDPCDRYFNLFLNPSFVNPALCDYHLRPDSPCIDAGDPAIPPDPDSTIVDLGAYFFDQNPPQPEPNIELSTTDLRFDTVYIGEAKHLPLVIFNVGDATLRIYDFFTHEPGFMVNFNQADSLIMAGDSLNLEVSFQPLESRIYDDQFLITNSDEPVQVCLYGVGDVLVGLNDDSAIAFQTFRVSSPYPNPGNHRINVQLQLHRPARVDWALFDPAGQTLPVSLQGLGLPGEIVPAGLQVFQCNVADLPTGVYFYRITVDKQPTTGKFILLK